MLQKIYDRVYEYIQFELTQANLKMNQAAWKVLSDVCGEIREAWHELAIQGAKATSRRYVRNEFNATETENIIGAIDEIGLWKRRLKVRWDSVAQVYEQSGSCWFCLRMSLLMLAKKIMSTRSVDHDSHSRSSIPHPACNLEKFNNIVVS